MGINAELLWGIDLGGTKIEGVVLHSVTFEVLLRTRIATEASLGYEHILHRIEYLVERLKAKTGEQPTNIGIGTPGICDPATGLMKNCNTTCLNGRPLLSDLENWLQMAVHIENDANCFALAETTVGCVPAHVPDANMVFGIIMGTGVGGGIVFNKRIWHGRQGIAGEWGHNYLDASGGLCYCGRTGCVETVLAGPALEKYYCSISNSSLPLVDISENFKKDADAFATQTMDRLTHFFALALSNVINLLDPDAIVVGGGVGNIDLLYTRGVEMLSKFVFNDRNATPVLKPMLGDSAGVLGAAMLTMRTR